MEDRLAVAEHMASDDRHDVAHGLPPRIRCQSSRLSGTDSEDNTTPDDDDVRNIRFDHQ